MKFFNWVHKRFNHHPIHKEKTTNCVTNTKSINEETLVHNMINNEKDTQALLGKAILVDTLDGWKDGILAIGTFGFDPLKPFNNPNPNPNNYLVLESEDDDVSDLTPELSLESSDDDEDSDFDEASEDEEVNPLMFSSQMGHSFNDDDIAIMSSSMDDISNNDIDMIKKSGRTTLADLFLAEAEAKIGVDFSEAKAYDEFCYGSGKKHNVRTNKTLSFAKKLIPKVKEDKSPIKNIKRLMRRMLKRKIHPELLDLKTQKSDGQMISSAIELVANAPQNSASESVSLLAI